MAKGPVIGKLTKAERAEVKRFIRESMRVRKLS